MCVSEMLQVNITKVDLATGKAQRIMDYVAEEKPLYLFVNTTFWAAILCSPTNLKELAVGHLLSEGILESIDEIREVVLKEPENTCTVKLVQEVNVDDRVKLSRLHTRLFYQLAEAVLHYSTRAKLQKWNQTCG